ncbi:MAG: ABC transporter substrate-binding protein [Gammaproteobacteria bacterium]|nr:ABC transporter substrate-binding protein [Gammaproteobacteria bacterium]
MKIVHLIGSANLIIALVLAVVCETTPAQTLPNHPIYDEIIARGTLEIAVYQDFPPFSNRVNGKLVGLDVDLGRIIAKKLGVEAVFHELQAAESVNDDLRNAIWKGHYLDSSVSDLMLHVPSEIEFAKLNDKVAILGSYFQEQLVVVRNIKKTGEFPTFAVFRFEKIGVELDSLPDFYLTGFGGGVLRDNVVHYSTVAEAVDAMLNEVTAAVFAPRAQIESALGIPQEKYSIDTVLAPGLSRDRWNLGVAVSIQNRQLGYAIDDILNDLVSNGEVEALFARHGLSYRAPEL